MTQKTKQKVLTGIVLDEQTELSLNDLSRACSSSAEWIIELVEEGAIEPIQPEPGKQRPTADESRTRQQIHWRFSASSLQRAHTARRLQRDLGINLAGVALAMDLLDEIETLRTRLCRLNMNDEI